MLTLHKSNEVEDTQPFRDTTLEANDDDENDRQLCICTYACVCVMQLCAKYASYHMITCLINVFVAICFSTLITISSETDECDDWESDVALQRCLEESLNTTASQVTNENK